MVWYGMVWYGTVTVRYGTVRYGTVRYGMVWYGMVWYGMVWYGMVQDRPVLNNLEEMDHTVYPVISARALMKLFLDFPTATGKYLAGLFCDGIDLLIFQFFSYKQYVNGTIRGGQFY